MLPAHKTYIAEYVDVMTPLCYALDVLQRAQCVSLGYLLPTLTVIKTELEGLLDRATRLTVCQPLISALLSGLDERFSDMFNDKKARLAAAVHPQFKLDWLDSQVQRAELTDLLKAAVRQELQTIELSQQEAKLQVQCLQQLVKVNKFQPQRQKKRKISQPPSLPEDKNSVSAMALHSMLTSRLTNIWRILHPMCQH